MAEGKKSFLLYCDLIHTVKKMPTEKAGELFKHILEYVNDENPQTDDLIIQLVFEPIKQQLKRDLNKWESEIDKKRNSGKLGNLKRWNTELYDLVVSNKMTIEEAEKVAQSRKESQNIAPRQNESHHVANIAVNDNDNVNVNVTVNDNVNVKEINKETKEVSLRVEKNYDLEIHSIFNEVINYFPDTLRPKNKSAWLDTIEDLIKKDKVPPEIIVKATKMAREDSFWQGNFMSLTKLRKKNPDKIPYITVFYEKFIKNGNKTNSSVNRKQGTTDEELANILADHFDKQRKMQ